MSKETATAQKQADTLRTEYDLAIEFRPAPEDFKTTRDYKEGEAEYEHMILEPLRAQLHTVTQPIIEEEMTYTSWTDSCQSASFERNCRRPRGHTGHHASGFGKNYQTWGIHTITNPYGRSV